MTARPASIDEYLSRLEPAQREALERLRRIIRSVAPDAEECISYGLPAFRRRRPFAAFQARPGHCSLYLMSSTVLTRHRDLVHGLDTSAGTIRFRPDEPLPAALVRRLVKARLEEEAAAPARKAPARKTARRKTRSTASPARRRVRATAR